MVVGPQILPSKIVPVDFKQETIMKYSMLITSISIALITGCTETSTEPPSTKTSYWSVEGKTEAEIQARIQEVMSEMDPRTALDRELDKKLIERYSDAIVIDGMSIGTPGNDKVAGYPKGFAVDKYETLLKKSKEAGFTMISSTTSNGADGATAHEVEQRSYLVQDYINKHNGYSFISNADDIQSAKDNGELGVALNFQSMEDVKNIEDLSKFSKTGVRQMTFTYNIDTIWATGLNRNTEMKPHKGLTDLGEQAVEEMNRLGIVIDGTHSSDQAMIETAEISSKPIIYSHSNARGVFDNPRNVSDAAIKAVASTDGAVCVNFLGVYLNAEAEASSEAVAKHVDYIGNLVGKRHTCFGADTVHNGEDVLDWVLRDPVQFPPSQGYGQPLEMGFPWDVWGVVAVLENKYGWSEDEIKGFLGNNLMRVYKANWAS